MQPFRFMTDQMLAQRGHLVGWIPVCLAIGIGGYFALTFEPGQAHWIALGIAGCLSFVASRFVGYAWAPVVVAVTLICLGAGLAKSRTEAVRGPVLDYRYFGPIQGRVVNIDRSASDATRLTFDRVVLFNVPPSQTPKRVRVSVHGEQPIALYQPGDTLMTTGHLGPPSGPAEPGGFDFQRHAWFLELGAVGYTRNPVLRLLPHEGDLSLTVFETRVALSRYVQDAMPEDTGGFAAAITTGDRSAIPEATMKDLRAANLAHLLAISGLHMGLLTGFIFVVFRSAFALFPTAALTWPTKKISAAVAIFAGAIYLALSGGNVATERAFIMVSVMFIAVILDRRALTLRAVAIAAVIVLTLRPEALISPGFQMSFAATTALVFVFGLLRQVNLYRYPKWVRGAISVIVSSGVAGLATAPFAAAHFNQMAHYGLLANVVSVPIMGALVMPSAVLALCLAPMGLDWIGLWLMDWGLRWILFVAETTAGQPGALGFIKAPGPEVLPVLALGLLTVVLWQGRGRAAGVLVSVAALISWSLNTRPDVLIADSGGFIGLMTSEGRDLSRATGHGFVSSIWLENDGAPVEQDVAAARDGLAVSGRTFRASLDGWDLLQVSGKTALADLIDCGGAQILVSNQSDAGDRPCLVFDQGKLRQTGSLAITVNNGELQITSSRDLSGVRPWNAYAYSEPVTQSIVLTKENGPREQPVLAER